MTKKEMTKDAARNADAILFDTLFDTPEAICDEEEFEAMDREEQVMILENAILLMAKQIREKRANKG